MGDTPLQYLGDFAQLSDIGVRVSTRRFACGQVLPVHTHPTNFLNHITVVMSGSMRCIGRPAIEDKIIKCGDVLRWEINEPHGFVALEDNTVILQIGRYE